MAPAAWDPPLWRSPQEGLKWLQVWVKVSWAERWAPHGPGCTCWLFACSGRTSVWWDSCSWIPCLLSLRRDGPKVPSAALWGEEPGPGFNDCNFVICFSMRRSGVSRFVFLSQGCFSYSESFVVAYDFYDHFSSSLKICLEIWEFIDCLYHFWWFGYCNNISLPMLFLQWIWDVVLLLCVFFNVFHQYFVVFNVEVFPPLWFILSILSFLNFLLEFSLLVYGNITVMVLSSISGFSNRKLGQVAVVGSARSVHRLSCEAVGKCTGAVEYASWQG